MPSMKKNLKPLLIGGAVVIAIGIGTWYFNRPTTSGLTPLTTATSSTSSQPSEVTGTEKSTAAPALVIGNPNAAITIEEYGDFKCPLCNQFARTTEVELKRAYIDAGKVKIVWKNLPIIAEDSKLAAEAAYCAADQSKFADYHDKLFSFIYDAYYKQNKLSEGERVDVFTPARLKTLAESAGLEKQPFATCLDSRRYASQVTQDLSTARSLGISGTPTFIIGNQKIVGPQPFRIFKPLIDAKL